MTQIDQVPAGRIADDGDYLIESEGAGIWEAMHAPREAGLPDPHFVGSGVQVGAILERAGGLTR